MVVDDVDEQRHDRGLETIGQVRLESSYRVGQTGNLGNQDGDALSLTPEVTRFVRMVPGLPLGEPVWHSTAGSWARPRGRSRGAIELSTPVRGECECVGQTTCGLSLRPAYGALEILDGTQANPGPLREGSLREPGVQSKLADQVAE
jgi:hypothetical protein